MRVRRQAEAEVIGFALSLLPERIRRRVGGVDFLTGVDPLFAGLHRYEEVIDGRSYRDTPHVAYEVHQAHLSAARRRTTVVLPVRVHQRTVVHELGHVLDWQLGFAHEADPASWYGESNRYEAFAEAFLSWVCPGATDLAPDVRTETLFESLASP
jgi:hypothetical protein